MRPQRISIVGLGGLGCPLLFFLLENSSALPADLVISAYDTETIELSNLNRQFLFREDDVGRPKVEVLSELISKHSLPYPEQARKLPKIELQNLAIVTPDQISELVELSSIVIDCTDNPALKLQLNDYCVSYGKNYIYAGAVGSSGLCLPVSPGESCLRCAFQGIDENEEASRREACSTAGIWGPVTGMIAMHAADLVFQLVAGRAIEPELFRFELAGPTAATINVPPYPACPLGCEHRTVKVTDLRGIPCPKNFVVTKLALENAESSCAAFLFKDRSQFERVHESLLSDGARPLIPPYHLSNGAVRGIYAGVAE